MVNEEIIQRDLKHIWHPCSQMKDFETCPPFVINAAKGCYLESNQGTILDAISSWWCKSLGHGHPAIIAAIKNQLDCFEHVISANTTNELLVRLGEKLTDLTQNQHHFFASDGSSAVEVALKMALQAQQILGRPHKCEFLSLENSYHGETLATLAVSDVGLYKKPFSQLSLTCHTLKDIPYLQDTADALWQDCSAIWEAHTLPQLESIKDNLCALIVEPIVQGAGGMLVYSADFLKRLSDYCRKNDIFFIADEIMTGIGRTGQWLASDLANINPDMICLSKGLTSGTIPFSSVSVNHDIFSLFYDDYQTGKAFLHSHTYSGNPLGAAAALATLEVIENEPILMHVSNLQEYLKTHMESIAELTGKLSNTRGIGAMVAADLEPREDKRMGYQVYQNALKNGALLRPLGNTLYWFPPLVIDEKTIGNLAKITLKSINEAYRSYG